ncbi:efflux RND transporter permease subunit [Planctomycetota bacterium]|nr:efflux RND transporter permease subunit [Planctomycetota bacterium]
MFEKLIRFSVGHVGVVVILAGLLLFYAGAKLEDVPVDVFPELNAPQVVIMTEAGGLSADEVESFITFPIETAVNGIAGVRRVRSASAISLSIVWVEFEFGEDIYRARQLVSERLGQVEETMPDGIHAEMAPITGISGEVMLLSVSSPDQTVSPLELRAWSEFDLTNRLLAVAGVAKVVAIGGELPEYQINIRQDQLRLHDLTVDDVIAASRKAHSIASAGYIANHRGKELPLRQTGRVSSLDDIRQTVVDFQDGRAITLGDVAKVELRGAPKRGTGAEGGLPAVILSVQKSPGVNTIKLTDDIDAVLEQARKAAPEGLKLNSEVMRQTDFIGRSIDNVTTVLRDAAILVAIVLILFLMNVRTTIITLTALPLSLAVALLVLWWLNLNINVMTLGGLAVAIGELVDDAIIDVENVFRRVREQRPQILGGKITHAEVVINGSNEIRSSIVFATIIIVLVFLPLLFLEGLEGRFFLPLGLSYIVAILASLVVAVTVTPALCRLLLKPRRGKNDDTADPEIEKESFVVRHLKALYQPLLKASMKLRWVVVALSMILAGASLWLASTFGTQFLPDFNEGTFTVFLMAPPGTSLDESNRLAVGVESRLVEIEGVKAVVRRTGRAERDEHAEPVSSSEIEVSIKDGYTKKEVRHEIDLVLAEIPGITTMVGQPIQHRLSHILSGTPSAIAINVYGEDLDVLRDLAKKIEGALQGIPGTRDVAANREVMIETIPIVFRNRDLAQYGLTPAEATEQVEAAFNGIEVAEVYEGQRRYRMVVRFAAEVRESPEKLKELILTGQDGVMVRLPEVATIGIENASNLITRENGRRKAVISANVAEGYNLGHLVEKVKAKVDPIVHKAGYSVAYGGQFEAQQAAQKRLLLLGSGVLALILLLLITALGNWKAAVLVMVNLPLALIGGVIAIFVSESPDIFGNIAALFGQGRYIAPIISVASMVGFITLFGIAVRNGILLVSHFQQLQKEGMPLQQAILQGSSERLVPILMTALTAVLGLIPLAMAAGEPGSELLAPLAVVVLGGLVTSTFLNLLVVPAGYALVGANSNTEEKQ